MKPFNRKITIIAILVLCIASIGFIGAVSAAGIAVTANPTTATTGQGVTFTFDYDAKYTYSVTATGSSSEAKKIASPSSGTFTHSFDTADTYTVKVEATNITKETDTKSGTTTVTVTASETKTEIKSVSLSLTAPATGDTAPTAATASGTGVATSATVTWSPNPSGGKFEAGKSYTATFTVNAENNYQFTDSTKVKINDEDASSTVSADKNTITATKTFSPTAAEKSDITTVEVSLTAPSTGVAAPETASATGTGVSTTNPSVTWSPALPADNKFAAETVYTAKITLAADVQHKFTTNTKVTNTPTGATVNQNIENEQLKVTITYPKTAAAGKISSVAATVTAPVTGEKPAKATESASSYKISKTEWFKKGSSTALGSSATFDAETEYTVKVTLEPESGYIFDTALDETKATINSKEVTGLRVSNTEATLTYTFPATAKLEGPSITLTLNPTSPIAISSNENNVTVTFTYKITGSPTSATLSFGDGSTAVDLGSPTDGIISGSKTHDFSKTGDYTAKIIAKKTGCDDTTKEVEFKITKDGLSAKFDASKTSGTAPLTVTFTDRSTGDIKTRNWDFGDGTYAYSGTTATHVYEKTGTYTVKLTVSDNNEDSSATKTITVKAVETAKPTATATATPTPTPAKDEKKSDADYEPFITIGGIDIPSPMDIIAEFVRLFQSIFDPGNSHIFDSADTKKTDKK